MSRLVREEIIIRLARGLFMHQDFTVPEPSAYTIAMEKAKAFGKQIVHRGQPSTPESIYLVTGSNSSFRTRSHNIICFRAASPRKMYLGDSSVGLVIRALWRLGKYACNESDLEDATLKFNRLERQKLRQSANIIPSWLNSLINRF